MKARIARVSRTARRSILERLYRFPKLRVREGRAAVAARTPQSQPALVWMPTVMSVSAPASVTTLSAHRNCRLPCRPGA